MTLIEQFEKESGMKYPKHDMQAQANFDELYEEWLEKRVLQWVDIKVSLPKNDNIDYLIFRLVDIRTIEDPSADCEFTWSIGTFKNGLFYNPGRDIPYRQDEITHWMELERLDQGVVLALVLGLAVVDEAPVLDVGVEPRDHGGIVA